MDSHRPLLDGGTPCPTPYAPGGHPPGNSHASPCTGRFPAQEGKYITRPCFSPAAAPAAMSVGLASKLPASCTVKCSSFPKTAIKAGCFNTKFKFSPAKSVIRWKVGIHKSGTTCSPRPARISTRYASKTSSAGLAGKAENNERTTRKAVFCNTIRAGFLDTITRGIS